MPRPDLPEIPEPSIPLPEESWREIEAALGSKEPNQALRCKVAHYVEIALAPYGPRTYGEVGGPRTGAVRNLLKVLRRDANSFAGTLVKLKERAESGDKDADQALYLVVQHWSKLLDGRFPDLWKAIAPDDPIPGASDEAKTDLRQHLSMTRLPDQAEALATFAISALSNATEVGLESLPKSKGGAPKDHVLPELVATLAQLYRDVTVKHPSVTWNEYDERYCGGFFDFVFACLRAFAPKYAELSNLALGKAIQRALKSTQKPHI